MPLPGAAPDPERIPVAISTSYRDALLKIIRRMRELRLQVQAADAADPNDYSKELQYEFICEEHDLDIANALELLARLLDVQLLAKDSPRREASLARIRVLLAKESNGNEFD